MAQGYEGRLELTWTNKRLALLAAEDGSYQWVPPSDYRVAEVRLLHDTETVGDVHGKRDRANDNLLIRGDALNALTALIELPEFARAYVGKVKLAYLDPPFNTQQSFLHYDDALEHSVWLTMMRDRLTQVRTLLSDNGSVWVHCDDSEQAYLKAMMDEVFGRDCFVATVIWEKTDSPRMDAKLFSVRHDFILVYRKSGAFTANRLSATDPGLHYTRLHADGRRYYINPLRARGADASREARPSMYFAITAPDGSPVFPRLPDGRDGRWRWGQERVTRDEHLIEWVRGKDGWTVWYRVFEPPERTRPPETIWPHAEVGSNRTSSYEIQKLFGGRSFSTPKPEALIERVLTIATAPDDIVLDCFAGSGTTGAVAHKMGRRWVLVERESATVEDFALPRLKMVVRGEDLGGITVATGWEGGGGFRVMRVAPSMFEESRGTVVLAEWATNGQLSEATAAQLGFEFEMVPPFAGRKGRKRLAVVDGMVTADVVRLLADAVGKDERLTVCGMAFDPEARAILKERAPGSTLRKIPASILDEYLLRRIESAESEAADQAPAESSNDASRVGDALPAFTTD